MMWVILVITLYAVAELGLLVWGVFGSGTKTGNDPVSATNTAKSTAQKTVTVACTPVVPSFSPDDTLVWVVTEGVKHYVNQHRSARLIRGYYYRYIGTGGNVETTFSITNHTLYPMGSNEEWEQFKNKLENKLKTEVGIIGCRVEVTPPILGENCSKNERAIWVGGAW